MHKALIELLFHFSIILGNYIAVPPEYVLTIIFVILVPRNALRFLPVKTNTVKQTWYKTFNLIINQNIVDFILSQKHLFFIRQVRHMLNYKYLL